MRNNFSLENESSSNKNKSLEEQFSLSREDFESYIVHHGWKLSIEDFKTDKKYKDISEDNSFQDKILVATFRSKLYPNIVASSSIGSSDLKKIQQSDPSKDLKESVYSWLASSGHTDLKKKELAYMGALTKQDIIREKLDFLKQENIKVEEVKIEQGYVPNAYTYYVTLRDLDDNTPWMTWGRTVDEAVKKALGELRKNQEQNKKWEKDMLEKWPEFMYLRKEYDEKLEKLGFWITSWWKNQETNEYDMSLGRKGSFSSDIVVKGSSWWDIFEEALKEAKIKSECIKEDSKGWLNVSSFTTAEIVDLCEGSQENIYHSYMGILYQKLESALDTNEDLPVKDEELDKLKAKCIEEERYELAAKITSYLKEKN